MNETAFRNLISGESRGVFASCGRAFLQALSWPYRCAVWQRNVLYDLNLRPQHRVNVPVIAVGNLTAGGTGKTPVVAWFVHQLLQLGETPGIVSRGYRADSTGVNDEKRVLEMVCPGVPHEQNPDRVAAATRLTQPQSVSAIVLDDAFQHRRMARDLNIVLIDATSPFGHDHLLPRGLLREPISSLKRADIVLLTRADSVDPQVCDAIETRVLKHNSRLNNRIFGVSFRPTGLISRSGTKQPLSAASARRAVIMTGIGNPGAFVRTCEQIGAIIAAESFFPDHHHYTEQDLAAVRQLAAQQDAAMILTTLKDLVKLPDGPENLLAVEIDTVFESASDEKNLRDELLRVAKMQG